MSAAGGAPGFAVVNLGCRVNRVETDLVAAALERAGLRLVGQDEADLVVVNTCAVTGEAETKTRKVIRHAARLPKAPLVVATGCVASLFSEELSSLAPNVVVEADKSLVARRALEALGLGAGAVSDAGELASSPTPTGRSRPGIKVQDGCDNRCTYCIVWKARGAGRSLPADRVLAAVREACARDAHEVVLTGINLGRYASGDARGREIGLAGLLSLILDETPVERVRLSSIEPPDVTGELLDVMASSGGRVAPFLHVCLQSGCDATLRRMGRVYDAASFRRVCELSREALPGVALGTDLIVGFPGETDEEFEESLGFCREMSFAKMHVFRYSRRPGTPAADAPGQVAPKVMAERSRRVRDLAARMRAHEASLHVGEMDDVLVEYPGRGVSGGLFDVLVDPRVPVGEVARVRMVRALEDGTLVGEAVRQPGASALSSR